MRQLILHIPHSSTYFPNYEGFIINQQTLESEVLKLTDWYTENLFDPGEDIRVVAPFSRIFCDVERFADDNMEEMARYGAGVCYEKLDTGEEMREVTRDLKEHILNTYYYPHHQKLKQAVEGQLQENSKAVIIDCHSFPDTPFVRDLDQHPKRPDINIGTDQYHTPQKLIEETKEFFKAQGMDIELNRPYSGTMVPLEYYQKDEHVSSIMIEVNRRLYLNNGTNEINEHYSAVREMIRAYIDYIKNPNGKALSGF
jgi:N-formylglutamate amidohydrolase